MTVLENILQCRFKYLLSWRDLKNEFPSSCIPHWQSKFLAVLPFLNQDFWLALHSTDLVMTDISIWPIPCMTKELTNVVKSIQMCSFTPQHAHMNLLHTKWMYLMSHWLKLHLQQYTILRNVMVTCYIVLSLPTCQTRQNNPSEKVIQTCKSKYNYSYELIWTVHKPCTDKSLSVLLPIYRYKESM